MNLIWSVFEMFQTPSKVSLFTIMCCDDSFAKQAVIMAMVFR